MKHLASYAFCIYISALFLFSCKAKYDFNERVPLKDAAGDVPNQSISQNLPCGTGKLEFDYTIVPDFELGILEIDNKGSCDIDVEITRQFPPGGTTVREDLPPDIKNFTIRVGEPPRINAFTIPAVDKGGSLHFKISCKGAAAETGCGFYYKFTTAKNIGNNDPATSDVSANPTDVISIPGATVPIGANKCVIPAGNEKVIKTITNKSKTDLYVTFEAVTDCGCKFFVVFGEPEDARKNKRAKAAPANPAGADKLGRAFIPKGRTVSIKLTCEAQIGVTDDVCDGRAVNIKITAKDNL